ncbi:TonB-dependent receptor plug domain-containing protein [Novosphingobium guangzhouense]|uniref:TonB-dependent receptor n=1 Tax=Novosphingobium guangzhouense TaxID=1850347 RepID=A0A2K2FT82_9SPHN|nr:TonB-dependent receptor [Novosphingobium guangzhouense]PNU01993.1 TonB-dependent receptor [Novosphingobium guangzhouense]
MKYLFLLGTALAVSTPVMAQDVIEIADLRRPDNDRTDITVTATREPTPITQVGQSVSVVTRAEIERMQATTATDVLARIPGVSTVQSGGFGQPASVFVRGAENAQSLVLLDGVRINDPGDVGGGFDFGALPIGQFDRVEVVRGSSGVLWGSRAIGSVINFITARPTEQWTARGQAEYGWRDRKQASVSAAGLVGPVGLTLGGNWLKGDGFSAFNERRGATEKDGFESKSANARASIEFAPGLSADAGGFYTKASYDYDDTGADAPNLGHKRDTLGYANLRYEGLDGRLNARVGYGINDTNRSSYTAAYGPYGLYESNGRTERFEGQVSFAPVEQASILVGGETEKQKFDDNYGAKDSTSTDSLFGNLTLRPFHALTLNGGVRYDDNADYGDRTTFSANGAWVIGEGVDAPVVRASYGEGFKAPSLYQIHTNIGYNALRPETSKGWDAGIEMPFAQGTGRFTVTYFDRKTRNLIDYVTIDPVNFTGAYFNVDRARSQGAELGMQVTGWQGFDVNLAFTYLDAKDRDSGTRLARRPRTNLYASIDKAWNMGLRLGADVSVGGGRYDDIANMQYVSGNAVVGLRGAFAVTDNVEVYGRIENLFDEHYELVRTYGTPGRSAYAGIRVKM